MSDYSIQVSWSGKDALSDSDPAKVVSGSDFNTEFTAVQTAVNSKADDGGSASDNFAIATATIANDSTINSVIVGSSGDSTSTLVGAGGSLQSTTTGSQNTAVGYNCLSGITSGVENVNVGRSGGDSISIGGQNTGIGNYNLSDLTTASDNTAMGYASLKNLVSGSENSALGRDAGRNTWSGSAMTTYSRTASVGAFAGCSASNQIQLGRSGDTVYGASSYNSRSDSRDKIDVRDTSLGLNFINKIQPREYRFDMREDYFTENEDGTKTLIPSDGSNAGIRFHQGVIAQEVKAVMDELGVEFAGYQDHKVKGGEDVLTMGYTQFIAPLIKAIQELTARVEQLEGEV